MYLVFKNLRFLKSQLFHWISTRSILYEFILWKWHSQKKKKKWKWHSQILACNVTAQMVTPGLFSMDLHWGPAGQQILPRLSCLFRLIQWPQITFSKEPWNESLPASSRCNLLFHNQQKIFLNQNRICRFSHSGCPYLPSGSKAKSKDFSTCGGKTFKVCHHPPTFGLILGHSLP